MTVGVICDRCSEAKEKSAYTMTLRSNVSVAYRRNGFTSDTTPEFDLCEACTHGLYEFLGEDPPSNYEHQTVGVEEDDDE